MKFDREEIKQDILGRLSGRDVEQKKLEQFVDALLVELRRDLVSHDGSDFKSMSELAHKEVVDKVFDTFSEVKDTRRKLFKTFMNEFQTLRDHYYIQKQLQNDTVGSFFEKEFRQVHIDRKELSIETEEVQSNHEDAEEGELEEIIIESWSDTFVDNEEDGIVHYETRVKQFEDGMDFIISALEKSDLNKRKQAGRPKANKPLGYMAKVFAMVHCLLGVSPTKSQTTTVFNDLVYYCLSITEGWEKDLPNDTNFSRLISPCYEDVSILTSLGTFYNGYGRLDLYVDHVLKTDHKEIIVNYFEEDWSDWKRPSNFSKLTQ